MRKGAIGSEADRGFFSGESVGATNHGHQATPRTPTYTLLTVTFFIHLGLDSMRSCMIMTPANVPSSTPKEEQDVQRAFIWKASHSFWKTYISPALLSQAASLLTLWVFLLRTALTPIQWRQQIWSSLCRLPLQDHQRPLLEAPHIRLRTAHACTDLRR